MFHLGRVGPGKGAVRYVGGAEGRGCALGRHDGQRIVILAGEQSVPRTGRRDHLAVQHRPVAHGFRHFDQNKDAGLDGFRNAVNENPAILGLENIGLGHALDETRELAFHRDAGPAPCCGLAQADDLLRTVGCGVMRQRIKRRTAIEAEQLVNRGILAAVDAPFLVVPAGRR